MYPAGIPHTHSLSAHSPLSRRPPRPDQRQTSIFPVSSEHLPLFTFCLVTAVCGERTKRRTRTRWGLRFLPFPPDGLLLLLPHLHQEDSPPPAPPVIITALLKGKPATATAAAVATLLLSGGDTSTSAFMLLLLCCCSLLLPPALSPTPSSPSPHHHHNHPTTTTSTSTPERCLFPAPGTYQMVEERTGSPSCLRSLA